MQRLGFPPNASLEHKKLSVELADVIIKWELQRIKEDETESKILNSNLDEEMDDKTAVKRNAGDDFSESHRKKVTTDGGARTSKLFQYFYIWFVIQISSENSLRINILKKFVVIKVINVICTFSGTSEASISSKMDESSRSIGKVHCDTVLNFLIRLACQVNDSQPTILNSGDNLSRR